MSSTDGFREPDVGCGGSSPSSDRQPPSTDDHDRRTDVGCGSTPSSDRQPPSTDDHDRRPDVGCSSTPSSDRQPPSTDDRERRSDDWRRGSSLTDVLDGAEVTADRRVARPCAELLLRRRARRPPRGRSTHGCDRESQISVSDVRHDARSAPDAARAAGAGEPNLGWNQRRTRSSGGRGLILDHGDDRVGLRGRRVIFTPNGARASATALTTAGGAPMAPPSPTPL